MLPDYPEAKNKLKIRLLKEIQETQARESGFIGKIPRSTVFEGDHSVIVRDDGTIQETNFKEIAATMTFTKEELSAATPEDLRIKMKVAAQDMAQKQTEMAFEVMNTEISKVGNSVDGKGRPFSIDLFFEAYEKIQIDFDPITQLPRLPTFVAHPDIVEKMAEELKKLEGDPGCKKKFEDLIAIKKGEWLVRENNRKLVG